MDLKELQSFARQRLQADDGAGSAPIHQSLKVTLQMRPAQPPSLLGTLAVDSMSVRADPPLELLAQQPPQHRIGPGL